MRLISLYDIRLYEELIGNQPAYGKIACKKTAYIKNTYIKHLI